MITLLLVHVLVKHQTYGIAVLTREVTTCHQRHSLQRNACVSHPSLRAVISHPELAPCIYATRRHPKTVYWLICPWRCSVRFATARTLRDFYLLTGAVTLRGFGRGMECGVCESQLCPHICRNELKALSQPKNIRKKKSARGER